MPALTRSERIHKSIARTLRGSTDLALAMRYDSIYRSLREKELGPRLPVRPNRAQRRSA